MKKILFLLPPSEGKNSGWEFEKEKLNFNFEKPCDIALKVTEKDLKCSWKRFEEGVGLNKTLTSPQSSPLGGEGAFIEVINRYSGVMYNAIDYSWMNEEWKDFFENNFLILSWMYWIISPLDIIWNYKLPIETKLLYEFWWTKIIEKINELNIDYIVNLLPISYAKLILWKTKKLEGNFNEIRKFWIINVNFLKEDWKKVSHWVKKIKWEWIKDICEKWITDYENFLGDVVDRENNIIDVNIVIKS